MNFRSTLIDTLKTKDRSSLYDQNCQRLSEEYESLRGELDFNSPIEKTPIENKLPVLKNMLEAVNLGKGIKQPLTPLKSEDKPISMSPKGIAIAPKPGRMTGSLTASISSPPVLPLGRGAPSRPGNMFH
jgi:hypothetical protein